MLKMLLQAIEATIAASAVNNSSEMALIIVLNFWRKDNFGFEGDTVIPRAALDLIQLVSTIKEATDCMAADSQEKLLFRVCAQ